MLNFDTNIDFGEPADIEVKYPECPWGDGR